MGDSALQVVLSTIAIFHLEKHLPYRVEFRNAQIGQHALVKQGPHARSFGLSSGKLAPVPVQPVYQRCPVVGRRFTILGLQVLQNAESVEPLVAGADKSIQCRVVIAQRLPWSVGTHLVPQEFVKRRFDRSGEQFGEGLGGAADPVKEFRSIEWIAVGVFAFAGGGDGLTRPDGNAPGLAGRGGNRGGGPMEYPSMFGQFLQEVEILTAGSRRQPAHSSVDGNRQGNCRAEGSEGVGRPDSPEVERIEAQVDFVTQHRAGDGSVVGEWMVVTRGDSTGGRMPLEGVDKGSQITRGRQRVSIEAYDDIPGGGLRTDRIHQLLSRVPNTAPLRWPAPAR